MRFSVAHFLTQSTFSVILGGSVGQDNFCFFVLQSAKNMLLFFLKPVFFGCLLFGLSLLRLISLHCSVGILLAAVTSEHGALSWFVRV